jgi:hypothetical protein
MRPLLLMSVLLLVGCSSEADVVLELHRATPSSFLMVTACDADHLDECETSPPITAEFGDDLVSRLGIYVDGPIAPPLRVKLLHTTPGTCRYLEMSDDERGTVEVVFSESPNADLAIDSCETCTQLVCPPP